MRRFKAIKSLFLVAMIASALSSNAVDYKGFVDVDASYLAECPRSYGERLSRPSKDRFSLLITTTHGIQFSQSFFLGAGLGLNQMGSDLSVRNMPMYFDARWTLSEKKKFSPFIDFKIGYSMLSNDKSEWHPELMYRVYTDKKSWYMFDYYSNAKDGFFIKPTIGCRLSLSDKLALNVGVTYYPEHGNLHEYYIETENGKQVKNTHKKVGKFTKHFIGLNVGIDF